MTKNYNKSCNIITNLPGQFTANELDKHFNSFHLSTKNLNKHQIYITELLNVRVKHTFSHNRDQNKLNCLSMPRRPYN